MPVTTQSSDLGRPESKPESLETWGLAERRNVRQRLKLTFYLHDNILYVNVRKNC